MSEYKDFNRCVICRSIKNLENYTGDFEVTMLLTTLYLSVMQPIENRNDLHVKSKPIVDWLQKNAFFNCHGNNFNPDDFVRYLRNGLAHFNIEVDSEGGEIKRVRVVAKNQPSKPRCKQPCDEQKCVPTQFTEQDGSICTYIFTVQQLRDFTKFVAAAALGAMPKDVCNGCRYQTEVE